MNDVFYQDQFNWLVLRLFKDTYEPMNAHKIKEKLAANETLWQDYLGDKKKDYFAAISGRLSILEADGALSCTDRI